jgi:hypothetical protein
VTFNELVRQNKTASRHAFFFAQRLDTHHTSQYDDDDQQKERKKKKKKNRMSYYPDDDGVKQRQPDDEGRGEREEKKKTTETRKGGVTAKQHFHREQQVKQRPREQVQIVQVVDPRPRYVPPAIGVPEDNPGPIFLGPGNHAPMMLQCYRCQKEVLTDVEQKSGTANVLAAIVTFGISLLACPIPDSYHFCRECDALIGVSKVA